MDSKHYLLEAGINWQQVTDPNNYPFSLPIIRGLGRVAFHPNITFFVGENGSGKSTLLESLAVSMGFNPEGGSKNMNFATRASHSSLHQALTINKGLKRPRDGFFLRAESFFNVATNIEQLDEGGGGAPIINYYGGKSLHEQSHGESFMSLLLHRFVGHGLYILDEPEAALSPKRQLALMARMHELIRLNSQFIIATHSPILLAYPGATIYQLESYKISPVAYQETEHFRLTKEFLDNPQAYLRHLLDDNQ